MARTRGSSDAGAVTLLTELDVFYMDHRRCGELDAGVECEVVMRGSIPRVRQDRRIHMVAHVRGECQAMGARQHARTYRLATA